MNPVLFNAVSGAERVMYAQHARSNNIANVNTVGYRALMEFTTPQTIEGDGFAGSATTRTNLAINSFAVGAMMKTDRQLDIALDNQGFIAVAGKAGEPQELYTRNGHMEINDQGEVMIAGRVVLGEQGPLVIPEFQDISISDDGVVSIIAPGENETQEVAPLKLVNPANTEVTLDASGLFRSLDSQPLAAADDVSLRAGFLEGSNTSAVEEMTGMLKLRRHFEVLVQVMTTSDQMMKAGNDMLRV